MTNGNRQRRRRPVAPRFADLAACALLALCLPGAASAQWATDAQGNITNTNPGHVGIGATPENPEGWAKVLDIFGSLTARFSLRTSAVESRVMSHDYGWWGAPAGMIVGTRTNHPLAFGTASTFRMVIGASGNVGVGTADPAEKLDVRGNVVFDAGANPNLFTGLGAGELNRYLQLLNSPGLTTASGLKAGGVLVSDVYAYADPGKNDLIVKGNVGVGTPTPAYKLDVAGQVRSAAGGFVFPDGTTQTTAATSGASAAANISAGQFGQNAGGGNYSFPASLLMNTSAAAFIDTGANNRFRVCGPSGNCSIAGEYIGGRLRLSGDGSFANAEGQPDPGMGGINAPGNAFVGGSVGVGTTSPAQKLDVRGNVVFEAGANPNLYTGTAAADLNRYLQLLNSPSYQSASGLKAGGVLISDSYAYADPGKNDLIVKGNVGIGTTVPTTRLHVAGDIRVDGNISAKYQDVAEWVPTTQKLAAGTVVTLDPERPNHVLASTASYDTAVAGVISEKPGLSLGEAGAGKALVATTGRVKVRVDATRGAIRIGDLLVTSEVAGVAMRSEPVSVGGRRIHAPGTIIGKALEPLAGGVGEILVLLSLQ
jgi:hypothetical protein